MKRLIIAFLVLLLLLSGCGTVKSSGETEDITDSPNSAEVESQNIESTPQTELPEKIKMPFSAEELMGLKCSDVRKKLELLGFTAIGFLDENSKVVKEPDADNITAYVKIGDSTRFSMGDEVSADQIVAIGIKAKEEENRPIEVTKEEKKESERELKTGFNNETNWTKEFGSLTFSIPSYFQDNKSKDEAYSSVGVLDNDTANLIVFSKIENCPEETVFSIIDEIIEKSLELWDFYQINSTSDSTVKEHRAKLVQAVAHDEGEELYEVSITIFVIDNTLYRIYLIQSPEATYDYSFVYYLITHSFKENELAENGNDGLLAKGTVGDSYIEVKDWQIKYDYSGKPVLVLTYDWTNNSDDTTSALMSVSVKGFQKGIELEMGILLDNSIDTGASLRDVRPGTTITVQEVFELSDTESEVEFEISELWNFFGKSNVIVFTIPLK